MADDLEKFINDLGRLGTLTKGIRVYARGTPQYEELIVLRFPNGISKVTRFVVEPDDEEGLRGLLELLGEHRIPFGIKSGGHISIPKINSPSEGILISLKAFNDLKYIKETETLDVGAGVIWKDVYDYLKPFASDHAPGVVGGDPLVGVSGWLLGGGFSLLTNTFGLGIDNIVGFRVILPGKGIRNASADENPDIFKALKGGGHNFGIVTRFTLRVHDFSKRTDPIVSKEFTESESDLVKTILLWFIQNDALPQAAVLIAAFRHDIKDGKLKSSIPLYAWDTDSSLSQSLQALGSRDLIPFFFGDVAEAGSSSISHGDAYEAFSLRHLPVSLETLHTDFQSVDADALPETEGHADILNADLVERQLLKWLQDGGDVGRVLLRVFAAGNKTVVTASPPDLRGRMASIVVTTYTRALIDEAEKRAKELGSLLAANHGVRASFEIWPFHKKAFDGVKREDSAWPHEEGKVFGPLVGWFEWSGRENDEFWLEKIENALEELHKVALKENCTTKDLPVYLNIALEDTPVEDIYRDHYEELRQLRREYDPENVMGLSTGFVIKE